MAELLILCPTTQDMRARLAQTFDTADITTREAPQNWLSEHGAKVRYVLTDGHIGVSAERLAALPNLEIISSYGVGYDGVDVPAALARGIPVCHTPGVLNAEVATTAVLLYLALWRNLEAQLAQARSGKWAREGSLPLSSTADGRRVGILGLGRIGKAIASKLTAFDAEIFYFGRTKQDVAYEFVSDLTDMAHRVDTVICAAPGDASTRHLINREVLEALGPKGTLVNVGRGSTVDEAALIETLQSGKLGGAALDVFEDEPHIPDALRSTPNVLLTPHIGSATIETRRAMGDLAIDNLLAHKEGRPLLTPIPECTTTHPRPRKPNRP